MCVFHFNSFPIWMRWPAAFRTPVMRELQTHQAFGAGGRSFGRSCAPFTNNLRPTTRRFFWSLLFRDAHQRFTFNKNSSARTRLNLCAEFIPGLFILPFGRIWIFIFDKSNGLIYIMELKIYTRIKTGKWRCVKYIRHSIKGGKKNIIWIMVLRMSLRGLDVRAIACKKMLCCGKLKTIKWCEMKHFSRSGLVSGREYSLFAIFPPAFVLRCCMLRVLCFSANLQVIYHSLKNVKFYSVENIKLNALKMIYKIYVGRSRSDEIKPK